MRFEADVEFLQKHGPVEVLEASEGGRIALSAKYQGRVMTSAVKAGGASLGWVHRRFIEAGQTGTQFDNYGGEDRFWLGPEGGQFGLYFPPGKPFEIAHWQTPRALQEGAWEIVARDETSVLFRRKLELRNHSGTGFQLEVARRVRLLSAAEGERYLGLAPGTLTSPAGVKRSGVDWVGFATENSITNLGQQPWTEAKGLLSIWILSMFPPAADAYAVIPYEKGGTGAIVKDDYFGKVPADRLQIDEGLGVIFFRCDGAYRSKIGLGPARATSAAGSYSASANLLTVLHYDRPGGARRYVNSMWAIQEEPYGGDVINSYNDGPVEPGKAALGGFYELETSSPAAALAPGKTLEHTQRTFHFVGAPESLNPISQAALGISLESIPRE